MTDFLTNLAARTLAAPALQPRVLSRFEPERRGEAVLPVEETQFVRVAAPPAPAPPAPPSPAPRTLAVPTPLAPDAAVTPAVPAPPRRTSAEPVLARRTTAPSAPAEPRAPEVPAREHAAEPQSPRRAPAAPRAQRREPRDAPRPQLASRPASRPAHNDVAPQPPRVEVRETTSVVGIPVVQRERETIVETRTETLTETREVRVPVEPSAAKPQPRSRHDEQPPVLGTDDRRPVEDREGRSERELPVAARRPASLVNRHSRELRSIRTIEPADAPPEPQIHVSIGRVEVRATTPPAAEKRRREQPRIMSLDDYAAQRARKERP